MRAVLTVLVAWTSLVGGGTAWADPAGASARQALQLGVLAPVAPGVEYRDFALTASHGPAHGHLLTVDLREPGVSLDLLYPGSVAARATVSRMVDRSGAVGGINGDFFNITESQHPGVEATGAPVGPSIARGGRLGAAVPNGQRFGPSMPPGVTTRDVIGVGTDGAARLDRLTLTGTVRAKGRKLALRGLNQYALPVGGIGAFTHEWGTASRRRATCGTDTNRAAPCSADTYELTVRRERVTEVAKTPGRGAIPSGSTVLVGRDAGAKELRKLRVGDTVKVEERLNPTERGALRFAIGGFPVLRDGRPLAGLNRSTSAVRTSAGMGEDGQRFFLLALDGGSEYRSGMTVAELADLMRDLGADDAVNLDGGGSSTLVTRDPDAKRTTVRNHPSGGGERAVANGIGIFIRT
ncbi:phosphodiester glycosidase family protein [Streptomyces olivoreticuli]|uniref:phosphodiester glycosidase family protein n=1 Tax=Streptomyces olivoreticuli TaxID=68246 RepID=UPI00265AD096|nr:phosphodiester glycosidase family protein [Streptomyces olivoreticuli]WKK24680.1 phosphodiester glycosidase family protein [Streptomyces olivoreticuli]